MATKQVRITDDDENWTKIVVEYFNEEGFKISVKILTEIGNDMEKLVQKKNGLSSEQIKKIKPTLPKLAERLKKEYDGKIPKRAARRSGGSAARTWDSKISTGHFPPGKDKLQRLITKWQGDGTAKNNLKDGIILTKGIDEVVIKKYKRRMQLLEGQIDNMSKKREKFGKFEFIKCQLLEKELLAHPIQVELKNQNEISAVRKKIFEIQKKWVQTKIDELKKIKTKQQKMWKSEMQRNVFTKLVKHAKNYVEYYITDDKNENVKQVEIDMEDLIKRYTRKKKKS